MSCGVPISRPAPVLENHERQLPHVCKCGGDVVRRNKFESHIADGVRTDLYTARCNRCGLVYSITESRRVQP